MRISVIVPSFNQGRFIEKTLRSVLAQGYPDLELIVIDGGSNDETVEVLRRYEAHLAAWVSEKDKGQSHAFNKGLARATGEIIGWLNSDDLYLNRCLFQAAEVFRRSATVDIAFADYIYIDASGRYLKRRKEPRFNYWTYLWIGACCHANCAGFFRRRVFETIGGLDETLHYGMDYEFYLRAGKAGMRFGRIPAYLGAYRLHSASKSVSRREQQLEDATAIVARYRPGNVYGVGVEFRKRLFSTWRLAQKIAMGSYVPYRPNYLLP